LPPQAGIEIVLQTDTKVQWTLSPAVAHPCVMDCCQERVAMENELSGAVNALPRLASRVIMAVYGQH